MALDARPSPHDPARSRLADALQSIHDDYSRVHAERNALRYELARVTSLASEQDSELTMIRRAIWNLQNQLQQYHQRFEEERLKLFDELRQQRAAAGLPPPSPLRELLHPVSIHPSGSLPLSQLPDDMVRESSRERNLKSRGREYPDFDSDEHREPKRMRPNDRQRVPELLPMSGPTPPHQPPPLAASKAYPPDKQTPPSHRTSPPSHNSTTAFPLPDDLSLLNVPPEYRKQSANYTVTFNPQLPKSMDVDLVCSIPHPSVVCSIQFSPNGRHVATGSNQATHIYDAKTGAQICSLIDPSLPKDGDLYIRSVRFSPDGEYLAAGGEDQRVRVWHIKQQSLCHIFAGHTNEIYALDYAQNGNFIISGSADGTARLWDLRGNNNSSNNNKVFRCEASVQECGITSISISPNCQFVAGGCLDGIVRIWNIATGEVVVKLRGHSDSVYAITFTADGKSLVSGSLDCTVKYWDTTSLLPHDAHFTSAISCPLIGNMRGHQDYVLSVACSNDNRWLVSGAKDRSLVLWDPLVGVARLKLQSHKNSVISVDINGPYIATASGDKYCRIWAYSSKDK